MYQQFFPNNSLHGAAATKAGVLTRLVTLLATVALGAAVLFHLSDYRRPVCILVSVAAIMLVVRSLTTGNIVWALPFLGVLGIFTPFQGGQFSHMLASILDLATLALLALSPVMFRRTRTLAVARVSGKL